MKSTAIVALLGCASAISINSEYRPNPTQSPWSAKSAKPAPVTAVTGAFQYHDKFHTDYERTVPEKYTAEKDDRLMNSIIDVYSVEQKNGAGEPTGNFFLNKKGALGVATEVAKTHFDFTGEK